MANIRKGEIDLLESIYHDIQNKPDMQDQAKELATLIENLDMRDIVRNERTRIAVAERRSAVNDYLSMCVAENKKPEIPKDKYLPEENDIGKFTWKHYQHIR